MSQTERHPMTPEEFDAKCRELRRLCPWLSETSGARPPARNAAVGGKPGSKHVLGMAQDFGADGDERTRGAKLLEAMKVARGLGFWVEVHDVGSGRHLHVQGLPPGDPPAWWVELYMTERGFA